MTVSNRGLIAVLRRLVTTLMMMMSVGLVKVFNLQMRQCWKPLGQN